MFSPIRALAAALVLFFAVIVTWSPASAHPTDFDGDLYVVDGRVLIRIPSRWVVHPEEEDPMPGPFSIVTGDDVVHVRGFWAEDRNSPHTAVSVRIDHRDSNTQEDMRILTKGMLDQYIMGMQRDWSGPRWRRSDRVRENLAAEGVELIDDANFSVESFGGQLANVTRFSQSVPGDKDIMDRQVRYRVPLGDATVHIRFLYRPSSIKSSFEKTGIKNRVVIQ